MGSKLTADSVLKVEGIALRTEVNKISAKTFELSELEASFGFEASRNPPLNYFFPLLEELQRIRKNLIVKCFSLRDDYLFAISGTQKHLVKRTAINKYVFIAELVGANKEIRPKMVSFNGTRKIIVTIYYC